MNNNDFKLNTVSSDSQLKDTHYIKFSINKGAAKKVLFVGNSITRHGIKEDIGWNRDCGMAASCLENDYVHVTVKELEKRFGVISYCVTHAVEWERNFFDDTVLKQFSPAAAFNADIVIIRIGENSDIEHLSSNDYKKQFETMVKFFANSHCQTIVTSLFWRYDQIDIPILKAATDNGYTFVDLNDLGEKDENKALQEFWHGGVKKHPNDLGMKRIAERILEKVK